MKTTVEIPDELMRDIKVLAANSNKKLKDIIPELLRKGMTLDEKKPKKLRRMQFPIVRTSHPAPPGEELSPERVHEILMEEEVTEALRVARRE